MKRKKRERETSREREKEKKKSKRRVKKEGLVNLINKCLEILRMTPKSFLPSEIWEWILRQAIKLIWSHGVKRVRRFLSMVARLLRYQIRKILSQTALLFSSEKYTQINF